MRPLCFVLLLAVFAGCGGYSSTTRQARDEFYAGRYSDAAKLLEKGAHEESLDQVLFLFDRATALHHASDYEESNKDFHLVDKLTEIKDYTSIASEAATIFTNDHIIPYKGEDFEKVLISQYLALNYLALGKFEDALVECRRVNHKLHLMITQGKRKYKLNPMAQYLAAVIYESQGEWNDAYVDYQGVHKLRSDFQYIGEDLYRLAYKTRNNEDMERWAREYHLSAGDCERIRKTADQQEVVVVIENGYSPEKHSNPAWQALPQYVPRYNAVDYSEVSVNGERAGRSYSLFDVQTAAIQNLDEKYGVMLAKRLSGLVAKEVIGQQIDKQNELAGAIFRLGMMAIDQADLRSWLTLPRDFQIFRYKVPAQTSTVKLELLPRGSDGSAQNSISGLNRLEKMISLPDVKKRGTPRKSFVMVRI